MNKYRLLIAVFVLSIGHQTAVCQFKNGPTEDSLAPPIIVKESLDNNFQPGLLKNKFLVIDFWATWCAPCIAGFPHFNTLADKFSGNNNIQFATMTDEDRQKVALFFNRTKKELRGLRLLDDDRRTMNTFSVNAIPLIVVIDKEGVVKWKGTTEQLKESLLDSIVRNIPLIKNDKKNIPAAPYIDPAQENSLIRLHSVFY